MEVVERLCSVMDVDEDRGSARRVRRVKDDSRFKRQGADILTEIDIPFSMLTLGGTASVATPEGKVRLKIPAGTPSGKVFILKAKGFPKVHGRGKGDRRRGTCLCVV